jgi:cation diffusion facilitator family transporter
MQPRNGLTRYAWLSIATALAIIFLKVVAYLLTGSIGFLSDALESAANIIAAVITLFALIVAARPPDKEHAFGHSKAEYLSSGIEGALILIAALVIIYQAIQRLFTPQPLEQVGLGMLISAVAAMINLATARVLLRAGDLHRSAALTADAQHLLTDVWTTIGVILGVGLAGLTGLIWLDPVIALIIAGRILFTGVKIVRTSANGLMDAGLPAGEISRAENILKRHGADGVNYHALRTRQAGSQRFLSVHIQVPGEWSVQRGHELLETIEREIRNELNPISVITHLEPAEDPVSLSDTSLNRTD